MAMRAVLKAQPRMTSALVFPSARRKADAQLSGWTQLVAGLVKSSGADFRMHDFRRTARTRMSQLGISEEIAELAIGHLRKGLAGLYNRDKAWTKRTEAFEKLSDHVAALVGSGGDSAVDNV
jgi:integrase